MAIDRLCNDHKNRTERPRACHVCQRLAIERDIVTKLVDGLLTAGYWLRVNDGEGSLPKATRKRDVLLKQLGDVDDEHIEVFKRDKTAVGWVRLVYGNGGFDVISDYTTNLDETLKPVNDYAETMA